MATDNAVHLSSSPRFLSSTSLLRSDLPKSTESIIESTETTSTPVESTPISEVITPVTEEPIENSPIVQSSTPESFEIKSPSALAEEEGRTVFVGGLSWNLDNDWLKEEVEKILEIEGGISSVRIARDHMGRSKGFVPFSRYSGV